MGFKRFVRVFFVMALAVCSASAARADGGAVDLVQTLHDRFVIISHAPQASTRVQKFERMHQVLNEAFDFPTMTKTAYGIDWDNVSSEHHGALVRAFSAFVAATYLRRLEDMQEARFERAETLAIRGEKHIVKTRLETMMMPSMEIDYVVHHTDKGWRIGDVLTNGAVSEVAQWRGLMRNLIAAGGPDAAIMGLKKQKEALLSAT